MMVAADRGLPAALERLPPSARATLAQEAAKVFAAFEAGSGPVVLPIELPAEKITAVLEAARLVSRCLTDVEEYALTPDGAWLHDQLEAALQTANLRAYRAGRWPEPAEARARRMRRPDGKLAPSTGRFAIFEMNQIAPQALEDYDADQRVAALLMAGAGMSYAPREVIPSVVQWLLAEHADRSGGVPPRRVAIVSEAGYPEGRLHAALARHCTRTARETLGFDTEFVCAYPTELRWDGARLSTDGRDAIDLIWHNELDLGFFHDKGIPTPDFDAALARQDRVVAVNGTSALLMGTKAALVALGHPRVRDALGWPPALRDALDRALPETLSLVASPDRVDEVLGLRGEWVSKPADSFEGQGVELGHAHTDASWRALVEARCTPHFVFQRYVPPYIASIGILLADGQIESREVGLELGPHQIGGRMTGTVLARGNLVGGATRALAAESGWIRVPLLLQPLPSCGPANGAGSKRAHQEVPAKSSWRA